MSSTKSAAIYNLGGLAIPILVTLATVPIYLTVIGYDRYGFVALTWVFLGLSQFSDGGFSRAAGRALARTPLDSQNLRKQIIFTAGWTIFGLGLVAGVGLYYGITYYTSIVPTTGSGAIEEYQYSIPYISASLPILLCMGVFRSSLESRGQFLHANIIAVVGSSLGQIVPLIVAILVGPELYYIVPAAVGIRALTCLTLIIVSARTEGIRKVQWIEPPLLTELASFGGWVTLSNLVSPVMASMDTAVVGAALGTNKVAFYSVPMSMVGRVAIIPEALARALFPRFSRLDGEEGTRVGKQAIETLLCLMTFICGTGVALSHVFLNLWIDSEFAAISTPITIILLLGMWGNAAGYIGNGFLQAQGRPAIVAMLHVAELPVYLLMLYLFTNWLGLAGTAAAWALRVWLDAFLQISMAKLHGGLVKGVVLLASFLCASAAVGMFLADAPVWTHLLHAAFAGIGAVALAYTLFPTAARSLQLYFSAALSKVRMRLIRSH
nr:oligosaccharide flippase family protein [uncultured Devosia sp.]